MFLRLNSLNTEKTTGYEIQFSSPKLTATELPASGADTITFSYKPTRQNQRFVQLKISVTGTAAASVKYAEIAIVG